MDSHRLETLERKVANLQWYIDNLEDKVVQLGERVAGLEEEKQKAQAVEPEPCTVCQSNICPGSPRFKGLCRFLAR